LAVSFRPSLLLSGQMSQTEPWTVGRLLEWTTAYFKGRGTDSPRLEAEVLLAESLGCRRIELYTTFDEVPGEQSRAAFRELVTRRAQGVPVAYLTGQREFYSLRFRVTPDVLVPRPETEFLVITLLDLARQRPAAEQITVCDVGTGSGVIAICVAKHAANCRATALDISPGALRVARANAVEHGVEDRIEFIESDLFDKLPPAERFDFIVSNPPYVSAAEMEALAPEVKDYEPRLALLGGGRGTEVIEALVPQAVERLKPGGHLLIEINPRVHEAVRALLESDDRLETGPTVKDLARLPRVVQAAKR